MECDNCGIEDELIYKFAGVLVIRLVEMRSLM